MFLQGFLTEFVEDLLLFEGVGSVVEALLRGPEDTAGAGVGFGVLGPGFLVLVVADEGEDKGPERKPETAVFLQELELLSKAEEEETEQDREHIKG